MSISAALRNNRLCASLTGLQVQEFKDLVEPFGWYYEEYWASQRRNPEREYGGGRLGALKTYEEKLFGGLMYLKAYATYDVFGFHIGCDRSQACRRIAHIFPVLELTLQRKLLLPQRKITSIEEFQRLFPEIKEIMVDGSERRRQRPKKKSRNRKPIQGRRKRIRERILLLPMARNVFSYSPKQNQADGMIRDLLIKNPSLKLSQKMLRYTRTLPLRENNRHIHICSCQRRNPRGET